MMPLGFAIRSMGWLGTPSRMRHFGSRTGAGLRMPKWRADKKCDWLSP